MVDISSARKILLNAGWLSNTPKTFQQAVFSRSLLRTVKKGASPYRAGDPPGGVIGVVIGALAVEYSFADRGPFLAGIINPGGWIGVGSALIDGRRRLTLKATRDSDLLCLPLRAINAIIDADALAWRHFVRLPIGYTETLMTACDDLRRRDHVSRFVATLLQLGSCRLDTPPNAEPIELNMGQDELANWANVARTTAGKLLRELEKAGYIDLSYRQIRIVAPDALRAMLVDEPRSGERNIGVDKSWK